MQIRTKDCSALLLPVITSHLLVVPYVLFVLVLTPSRARTGLVKKQEGGSNPYCSNPESNPVPNVLVRALTFLLVLTRALHRR